MPRLIHAAAYGGQYPGSFIPMIRAALVEARARGWRVEAVFQEAAATRPWLRELARERIPVSFVPLQGRRAVAHALGDRLAADEGPTILHTHFTSFDLPAVAAARRHPGTAVVWHVHTSARAHPAMVARNVLKYTVAGRRVGRILCVGPHLTTAVRRRGGGRKAITFPNAIDMRRFSPVGDGERQRARASLGVPPSAAVLLHLAWDWRQKGGDLLLAAVGELMRSALEPVVLSVGAGSKGREAIRRAGLEGIVHVLEPAEDARSLYAAADVLVAPSRGEGMPFSILEALALGLPVVATRVGGLAGLEHVPGCRIVPRTPADLARGIAEALRHSGQEESREMARAWVGAHHDLRAWSDRLLVLYEQVLSEQAI